MFEWDAAKESENLTKHGVDFSTARLAFADPHKIIVATRSVDNEQRYFCIGKVEDRVLTVRFVIRNGHYRIFGAAYYRRETKLYAAQNK